MGERDHPALRKNVFRKGREIDENDDLKAAHLGNAEQVPGSGSDPGLGFGSWRTPDSNRPVRVVIELLPQTDGTNDGEIAVDVDYSGGTTADDTFNATTPGALASGDVIERTVTLVLPPGAAYQVRNVADPNSANATGAHREHTL